MCSLELDQPVAGSQQEVYIGRSVVFPWKAGLHCLHLSPNPAIPSFSHQFFTIISRPPFEAPRSPVHTAGHRVGKVPSPDPAKHDASVASQLSRSRLVGRCQHFIRDWRRNWRLLGGLALGSGLPPWPFIRLQHWLGRSSCRRAWRLSFDSPRTSPPPILSPVPDSLRQPRGRRDGDERTLPIPRIQRRAQTDLPLAGRGKDFDKDRTRSESRQRLGFLIPWRHPIFSSRLSPGIIADSSGSPPSVGLEIAVFMNPTSSPPALPPPTLKPSSLRPDCTAKDRLFRWKGVNTPPPSTIINQWMQDRESAVFASSISDPTSYGAGLKKFHIFCDLFDIPERDRLPVSFDILHSFILWATADATIVSPSSDLARHSNPISESTARHYLAAIRAWHIVQGWNPPLTDIGHDRINFSLRGIAKLQAERHKQPIRPPVTTTILRLVQRSLDLNSSFDACIWVIATCAFWGMMRSGEATVRSQ